VDNGCSISGSKVSSSSKSSARKPTASKMRKKMDEFKCLYCGYTKSEKSGSYLSSCHIYELRAYNLLSDEHSKKKKRDALGLEDINDVKNMITLCGGCHDQSVRLPLCG
jgi:5-methylcytosine-specific restriction endonuclease McrA